MPQTYWRLTLAFAVATTLMSIYLLPLFPSTAYSDVSGYGSPVFAFEMASSTDQMYAIFGPEDDPQHAERVAQMDNGNRWDFGFMFLYAMFLGLFSFAAYKATQQQLWLMPVFLGLLSGGCDAIENLMLLKLTADFYSTSLLSTLWVPVYAKFAAIACSSFGGGLYIFRSSGPIWKLIGIVAMLASVLGLLVLIKPSEYGWLIRHSVTFSWVPMLLFSLYKSFARTPNT